MHLLHESTLHCEKRSGLWAEVCEQCLQITGKRYIGWQYSGQGWGQDGKLRTSAGTSPLRFALGWNSFRIFGERRLQRQRIGTNVLTKFLDNDGIVHCQFDYVMTIGSDWWKWYSSIIWISNMFSRIIIRIRNIIQRIVLSVTWSLMECDYFCSSRRSGISYHLLRFFYRNDLFARPLDS